MDTKSAQSILDFWFSSPDTKKQWYFSDVTFDKAIKSQFGTLHSQFASPHKYKFSASAGPKVALATIILLDQFSRNLYRGSPKAFANDASAREIAEKCVARNWDLKLNPYEKMFMYMPFMHAEDLTSQTMNLVLFRDILEKATETQDQSLEEMKIALTFAKAHYRTIEKFGRFPARNEALGRQSTEEEKALVAEGKGGFVYEETE